MQKSELAKAIAESLAIHQALAQKVLDATLDLITEKVGQGEEVSLTGFGTFAVVEKAARMGRNVRTGEPLVVPAHRAVSFKAGKGLKEAARNSTSAEASA